MGAIVKNHFWWSGMVLLACTTAYTLSLLNEENLWELHSFKGLVYLAGGITAVEVFLKRKNLFANLSFVEGVIGVVAAAIAATYVYKFKLNLGLSIALLLLCLGYGLYKRNFYKPHPIMLALFCFSAVKLVSVLWAPDKAAALEHIDDYWLFIFLPIVSSFYRPKAVALRTFIYLPFISSLLLLLLTVIDYVFLMKHIGKPLTSFLTLDKTYLGLYGNTALATYYQPIRWSYTFHPSKVAWGFLVIWTMACWLWREEREKTISAVQLLVYALLLFVVMLVLQARVALLGTLIIVGFFGWVTLMKWIGKPRLIAIFTLSAFAVGSWLTKELIATNSFFKDEGRAQINEATLSHFIEHPLIGGGAGYETQMIHQLNIDLKTLHNDFLSALADQGVLGLGLLLLFHALVVVYGLKHRYLLGIYVLLAFAIFNSTEGVMGYPICIPFFLYCLIPPVIKTEK
nr:O-antigen ligase family protein [uncultured Capnocytophaga sp.]